MPQKGGLWGLHLPDDWRVAFSINEQPVSVPANLTMPWLKPGITYGAVFCGS